MNVISGSFRISIGDQLDWLVAHTFATLPRTLLVRALLCLAIGVRALALELFSVAVIVGCTVIIVILAPNITFVGRGVRQAIFIHRLSEEPRAINWSDDEAGLSLTDRAGNRMTMPWSEVTSVSGKARGFLVRSRSTGSRWIPRRAFSEEAASRFMSIATKHTQTAP